VMAVLVLVMACRGAVWVILMVLISSLDAV
jgi:hypothetical protein